MAPFLFVETASRQWSFSFDGIEGPGGLSGPITAQDYGQEEDPGVFLVDRIDVVMKSCNVKSLKGIAIGNGPGSFAGIRMGFSLASAFSLVFGCPVYGADHFCIVYEGLSLSLQTQGCYIVADTRGQRLAVQLMQRAKNTPSQHSPIFWGTPQEIACFVANTPHLVTGDGLERLTNLLPQEKFYFLPPTNRSILLGRFVLNNLTSSCLSFNPLYGENTFVPQVFQSGKGPSCNTPQREEK